MNKFQEIIDSRKSAITKMTNLLKDTREVLAVFDTTCSTELSYSHTLESNEDKGSISFSIKYATSSSEVYKNEFRGYAWVDFPSNDFSSASEFTDGVQSALEKVANESYLSCEEV